MKIECNHRPAFYADWNVLRKRRYKKSYGNGKCFLCRTLAMQQIKYVKLSSLSLFMSHGAQERLHLTTLMLVRDHLCLGRQAMLFSLRPKTSSLYSDCWAQ